MAPYPGGIVGFAVVAVLTHAALGYVLGSLVFDAPRAGIVGGVAADSDHLLEILVGGPFVHRGVMHSALAVGVAVAITAQYDRRAAGAVGLGYLSHVLLDATTPMGVMLGYPLSSANVGIVLYGHAPPMSALVVGGCLLALVVDRRRPFGLGQSAFDYLRTVGSRLLTPVDLDTVGGPEAEVGSSATAGGPLRSGGDLAGDVDGLDDD